MDSAPINGLIYQAVYITIFVIATSITINLFTTINEYTDKVSSTMQEGSITEIVTENENIYDSYNRYSDPDNTDVTDLLVYELTGYEVFSLVNNYGMATSETAYSYGKKYNGKVQLECKIKVYNKSGSLITNIDNINLTAKYSKQYTEIGGSRYVVIRQK